MKVVDQIPGARAEDISRALPAILVALRHQDDNVKIDAAFALTVISRRPDSSELLRRYIGSIAELFELRDPRLQGTPTLIFAGLRPVPPPEVLPLLLAFLKRADRDPRVQGAAVFALVQIAAEKPEVIAEIRNFFGRPLDTRITIDALNALGNPKVKDASLIRVVIDSLDDPDQGVRLTAIQVLARIGYHALVQAEPSLQRIANRTDQPVEVRAAAKEALKQLRKRKY